jgi:hypothetical protein
MLTAPEFADLFHGFFNIVSIPPSKILFFHSPTAVFSHAPSHPVADHTTPPFRPDLTHPPCHETSVLPHIKHPHVTLPATCTVSTYDTVLQQAYPFCTMKTEVTGPTETSVELM